MTSTLRIAGLDVTRIGLGTNRLSNKPENVAFLKEAVEAGIQMIDTAHLYTGGESETTIGAALSPLPAGCLIATKGGFGGAGRGRPEVLAAEIEESLRRLRTEVIDLYYLHRVDPETPLEESLGAIKQYVDRGAIRHVGVSDVTVEQIERAGRVSPVAAVQNHFNLAERKYDEVVDHCTRRGIPFVPYFPLRGDGGAPQAEIAARRGISPAQVALAWLLKRSPMMLPIPGTLSAAHARDNLAALDVDLSDEEFAALS